MGREDHSQFKSPFSLDSWLLRVDRRVSLYEVALPIQRVSIARESLRENTGHASPVFRVSVSPPLSRKNLGPLFIFHFFSVVLRTS